MVTINKANITKTEVSTAAKDAGISSADLRKLAGDLQSLAQNMNFGDGQALAQLASLIGEAAGNLGTSTQQNGGGGGGFTANPGATAPPGT